MAEVAAGLGAAPAGAWGDEDGAADEAAGGAARWWGGGGGLTATPPQTAVATPLSGPAAPRRTGARLATEDQASARWSSSTASGGYIDR